jgi:hypothetical protein
MEPTNIDNWMISSVPTSFVAVDCAKTGEAAPVKAVDAKTAVKARRWERCSLNAASLGTCAPIAFKSLAQPYFNERITHNLKFLERGKGRRLFLPPVKYATNKHPESHQYNVRESP